MEQLRADIRLKKAAGEPWKTIGAVVTGLTAVFNASAIGSAATISA